MMKPLNSLFHFSLSLIVGGLLLLTYVLFHLPALQLLGASVSILSFGVALYCAWLWNRPVDQDLRKKAATIAHIGYECAKDARSISKTIKLGLMWKRHECARHPQFWAMFLWIMYCGFIATIAMHLDSLQPPCAERHDCVQTEANGIYTGKPLW